MEIIQRLRRPLMIFVLLIDTSRDVFRTQPLLIYMCSMYANI